MRESFPAARNKRVSARQEKDGYKNFFLTLYTLVIENKGLIEAFFNMKKEYKCNGNLRYALICINKGIEGAK